MDERGGNRFIKYSFESVENPFIERMFRDTNGTNEITRSKKRLILTGENRFNSVSKFVVFLDRRPSSSSSRYRRRVVSIVCQPRIRERNWTAFRDDTKRGGVKKASDRRG